MNIFERKNKNGDMTNSLRTIFVPSDEKEEIKTRDMWVVSWYSRHGQYMGNIEKRYQSFFSYEDANKFKDALERANKLIGNTGDETDVWIEKQQNCLLNLDKNK